MKEIKINTDSKNYSVLIGANILTEDNLKEFSDREVLLVIDSNIEDSVKNKVRTVINSISSKFLEVSIRATEENKSYATLTHLHDILIEKGYSRECVLFALGGGITCDITGFAAATYQRGVDFVLMPSTLLAQVDASVGGKTAINHPKGKNMIGAFHQPSKVLSDTNLLKSLKKNHLKDGLAEIIKHSLIKDARFFDWLQENIDRLLEGEEKELLEAIAKSVLIKAEIVSKDETEKGVRKWLNLGHTFGHAIEVYGNYKDFSHGEAVALGIIMATNLSQRILNLQEKESQKIKNLINSVLTSESLQKVFERNNLFELMSSDKKKKGDKLNFILLNYIGSAETVSDIKDSDILESIKLI
tara:strand:+ start:75 stop:1148 length:1074 start_codon:yes stop_codon:yes gene_type:complete